MLAFDQDIGGTLISVACQQRFNEDAVYLRLPILFGEIYQVHLLNLDSMVHFLKIDNKMLCHQI